MKAIVRFTDRPSLSVSLLVVALACSSEREFGTPADAGTDGHAGGTGGGTGGSATGGSATGGSSTGGSSAGGTAGGAMGGAAGMAGSAGAPGASGASGSGSTGVDSTRPQVVSIVPMDGAKGIRSDASIVITFSEPMDKARTQAAFQSATIAPGLSVFTWNQQGTTMTVKPQSLPYATGTSPAVAASTFSLVITDAAEDLAGNPLAEEFTSSFQTLRRITQTLHADFGEVETVVPTAVLGGVSESLNAGDNSQKMQLKSLITFDITPLPAGVVEFMTATFSGIQTSTSGFPYSSLGDLTLEHTNVAPSDWNTGAPVAAFAGGTLRPIGVLSETSAKGKKSIDVLSAVIDDYEQRDGRDNRSQYRAFFPVASDNDTSADWVVFAFDPNSDGGPLTLEIEYLVP